MEKTRLQKIIENVGTWVHPDRENRISMDVEDFHYLIGVADSLMKIRKIIPVEIYQKDPHSYPYVTIAMEGLGELE